jgi:hypothetical protein
MLFFLSPQIITSRLVPILFHVVAHVHDLILYKGTKETINFVFNEHPEHYTSKNTKENVHLQSPKKKPSENKINIPL